MPSVEPFRGQKYREEKKKLLKSRNLFVDPEFPPSDLSIFISSQSFKPKVEWKRPGEIVRNPHLFVEGVSDDDVTQGILGNCWFVAACSALTHYEELWKKVIPDASEQEWDANHPEKYCGIFHFCFWRFGRWIDVVIDDLLPMYNGELLFAKSKTRNEFWSALLEKAFAKLNGCYEALTGGSLAEALVDITGGVPETVDLTVGSWKNDVDARVQLFNEMREALENKSLMAAAISANSHDEVEQHLASGLVKGHSYAITDIRRLSLDRNQRGLLARIFADVERVLMVKLFNPWGEQEWTGPWSDGSSEWDLISKEQQEDIGLRTAEDGEFWMTFDDFVDNFTDVSICHMLTTHFFALKNHYNEESFTGLWNFSTDPLANRAGGCTNFKSTFLQNPQYRFDVPDDNVTLVLCLMQKDVRELRRVGAAYLIIGIHVMKVEENRKYRLHQIMQGVGTSEYASTRSVFLKLKNLRKGRYVAIPTTFSPGEEGEFLFRIFSSTEPNAHDLTLDLPPPGPCVAPWLKKDPLCCTRLHIKGVDNLQIPSGTKTAASKIESYCVLLCEGERFRSPAARKSDGSLTTWDFSTLFLRKNPKKPIIIEVFVTNVLHDQLIGRISVDCPITNDNQKLEVPLVGKQSDTQTTDVQPNQVGLLLLDVSTFDSPIHL